VEIGSDIGIEIQNNFIGEVLADRPNFHTDFDDRKSSV